MPDLKGKNRLFYATVVNGKRKSYWYETDGRFFEAEKPSAKALKQIPKTLKRLPGTSKRIENPWLNWKSSEPQNIHAVNGVPLNYLKTTDNLLIQQAEDRSLTALYYKLLDTIKVNSMIRLADIKKWHRMFFADIYPFAGEIRRVELSASARESGGAWQWRLSFLAGIPDIDKLIQKTSNTKYTLSDPQTIAMDLSILVAEFLFIHPFREGNGRMIRLLCDMILAKNGFPLIGVNLKESDTYIQDIHKGYDKDYAPLANTIQRKIIERKTS